ncbi:hypothetical protein [Prosthecomicrobium pneumaticum]|uniref:Uncharacterized protein n=1 Tax=Prosthecomicrobium pneumaticum TaxID=81895 RepID=A0A7W9FME4_9HYPH|nr:hypothetical protein [Prosthecomicrobium pneumaticum]MBB5753363.1 hypothetical protein [Prosthecomicrobium pneumaticum]
MDSLAETLSSAEIETVRRALKATVEGSFFPDWEFETLIGVDRGTVQQVHEDWPIQTVDQAEFSCAVIGSMNSLIGYPHGKDDELAIYVPEGRSAIQEAMQRLTSLGV